MNAKERLDQKLADDGVVLLDTRKMREWDTAVHGMYSCEADVACIAVYHVLGAREQLETEAHESGHHYTGASYEGQDPIVAAKTEQRAFRWAVRELIPIDRLIAAICSGLRDPWSLADEFEVTPRFMEEAIKMYRVTGDLSI